MNLPTPQLSHIRAPQGTLAVRRWGTPGRPVVVLVHGYPDNASQWDAVARYLEPDFDVLAYDVRGAGHSFVPPSKADYRLSQLTEDFSAVIDAVSPHRPVHLVGHDWGSVQGWEFVTEPRLAGRIASFTSCSGPCLDHIGHWVRQRLRQPTLSGLGELFGQTLKSWYVYFFQLPWLPEALWHAVLGRQWPRAMRWLEHTDIPPRATQTQDGAQGVNLYRANFVPLVQRPRERIAHAPVLVLVPLMDRYVSPALSRDIERWAPQLRRREVRAGHWITLRHPQMFAQAVREHIEASTATASSAPGSRG